MEKIEWRDVFNRQPAYYIFLDLTLPMTFDTLEKICLVVKNITALSVSLKGSLRFSVLGIYTVAEHCKCVFPLQSLKLSCTKLQISLDTMKSTHAIFTNSENYDSEKLSECLQDAVQQYEKHYQVALPNKEEWPQLEIVFFSAQPARKLSKIIQDALMCIHLDYIRKVQVIVVKKSCWGGSSCSSDSEPPSTASSQIVFDEDRDLVRSVVHVTEMEGNAYQLEKIFKSWLLDCGNDSDHLRLTINDQLTLRCDLRECLLGIDALPAAGNFHLAVDAAPGLVGPAGSRGGPRPRGSGLGVKVPVYSLDAYALVKREGLCGSLIYGQPYVAVPTKCWKVDWEELERNQHHFSATVRHLQARDLVLLAKRLGSRSDVPRGLFAFFPSDSFFLVKSVAVQELLLPRGELACPLPEGIAEEVQKEVEDCLEGLEIKEFYNPLAVYSGLYASLTASATRMSSRPQFLPPLADSAADKKRRGGGAGRGARSTAAVAQVSHFGNASTSAVSRHYTDFVSASALLKSKFPTRLE